MAKNSKSLGIPLGHMVSSSLLFSFFSLSGEQKWFGELDPSAIITNVLAVPVDPVVVKHPWVRSRNQSIHVYQSVMCGLRRLWCETHIFLDLAWQSKRCRCIFKNGFLNVAMFFNVWLVRHRTFVHTEHIGEVMQRRPWGVFMSLYVVCTRLCPLASSDTTFAGTNMLLLQQRFEAYWAEKV